MRPCTSMMQTGGSNPCASTSPCAVLVNYLIQTNAKVNNALGGCNLPAPTVIPYNPFNMQLQINYFQKICGGN